MKQARHGIVDYIAGVVVGSMMILAVVGAGYLVWNAYIDKRYFHILGVLAIVLATGSFLVLGARCLLGELLLPYLIVLIFASVPAFFVARSFDVPPLWRCLSAGTVILGVGVLVFFILGLRDRLRTSELFNTVLLAVALGALGLSSYNQGEVLQLTMDVQAVIDQRRADMEKIAEAEKLKQHRLGQTGGPMAATMSEEEAMDLGGMSSVEADAWRKKLKEAAAARRRLDKGYGELVVAPPEDEAAAEEQENAELYGKLVDEDYVQEVSAKADTWHPDDTQRAADFADHLNVGAKYILLVTVMMSLVVYFSQLNRTDCACYPLPLAGRWLDNVAPKDHLVWFDADDEAVLDRYLRMAVRKGESFVCMGDPYPVTAGSLPRWSHLGLAIFGVGAAALVVITFYQIAWAGFVGLVLLLFGVAAVLREGLRQEHLRDDEPEFFANSRFAFESAWFGRLSFSIKTPELAERFLRDFCEATERRRSSRAAVNRTLNLVWCFGDPPAEDLWLDLAAVARRENLRLIFFGGEPPPPAIDAKIEAIYDEIDLGG